MWSVGLVGLLDKPATYQHRDIIQDQRRGTFLLLSILCAHGVT